MFLLVDHADAGLYRRTSQPDNFAGKRVWAAETNAYEQAVGDTRSVNPKPAKFCRYTELAGAAEYTLWDGETAEARHQSYRIGTSLLEIATPSLGLCRFSLYYFGHISKLLGVRIG